MSFKRKTLVAATTLFILGSAAQYTGQRICESYNAYTTLGNTEENIDKPYTAKFLDGVCNNH